MEGARRDLWALTVGALSSDCIDDMDKAEKRHDTLFFYEYTQLLLEAIHCLQELKENVEEKRM